MKYTMLKPRAYFKSEHCAKRFTQAIIATGRYHAGYFPNLFAGGFTVMWV